MTKNETYYGIRKPNLRGMPYNKTTLFMLPAIGFKEEKTSVRLLRYYGLINCYLSHKQSMESYPDCLSLVFNPTDEALAKFKDFYNIYRTYPNYVDDYVVDHNLIVVVFKVLPKWLPSFNYFKQSKYSKMAKDYAELFRRVDMGAGTTKATNEYFIMKRDPAYRKNLEESLEVVIDEDAELLDKLKMEEEIFDYGDTSDRV